MDDRDRKLEHFAVAIFVSAVLWTGTLLGLRIFVEVKSCTAERSEVRQR